MKKYNEKIHWTLAGAFARFDEISHFAIRNNLLRHYKRITVYDGLNHCAWNGGRIHSGIYYDKTKHDFYDSLGWGIRLVFTNFIVENLHDDVGNWLLETFHREGNGIILINDDLRRYIRKNYPKYELVYSVGGFPEDALYPFNQKAINFYKDIQSKFDCAVLRPDHNFDPSLHMLESEKLEFLVNEDCVMNCDRYKSHFTNVSQRNRTDFSVGKLTEEHRLGGCSLTKKYFEQEIRKDRAALGKDYPFWIQADGIRRLIDSGYTNLKLQGRQRKDLFSFFLKQWLIDYDAPVSSLAYESRVEGEDFVCDDC